MQRDYTGGAASYIHVEGLPEFVPTKESEDLCPQPHQEIEKMHLSRIAHNAKERAPVPVGVCRPIQPHSQGRVITRCASHVGLEHVDDAVRACLEGFVQRSCDVEASEVQQRYVRVASS